MNSRIAVVALLTLVAVAGTVLAGGLVGGCNDSGCMMGPNCTMGQMGGAGGHCDKMKPAPAPATAAAPAASVAPTAAGDVSAASAKVAVAAKAVNSRCPMMGGSVDINTVPASLTREYKGQTVGFCCGGCPGNWDKLADADKDARLAKVTGR